MKKYKFFILISFMLLNMSGCDFISQPGFDVPVIVITFDDAHQSIYENALPLLNEYGYPATNVINTAAIGSPGRLDWDQVTSLEFQYGWETAGHTLHHVNLPECDYETSLYEIEQDWQNLVDRNLSHETFALPSGHATPWQFEIIQEFYQNIRTSLDIEHKNPLNRILMGYFVYQSDYNTDLVKQRIMQGIENNEILIILGFHVILLEDNDHIDNCTPAELADILDFIDQKKIPVLTLKDAVNRLGT